MKTLHALMPPLARFDADPSWRRWLVRGDRLPPDSGGREGAVRGLFHFAGDALPVAALRHHALGGAAGVGIWLCADPAYVRSEATGARLMTWPVADLTLPEARDLAAALRPLLGDAGAPLEVGSAQQWCVRLAGAAPRTRFTAPAAALGVNLIECLPDGEDGRTWRRLFNEVQVALHAHPVNAARVAAGKLPVTALWFWGPGALPAGVDSSLRVVASDDPVLHGLARLAGAAVAAPTPDGLDAAATDGDALFDLDAPATTDAAARWLAGFQRALRARRCDAVELGFASGERFRVRHAHRWRLWRRG